MVWRARRVRRLLARIRAFVSTRADDQDFEEELTTHLDLLTEDNIRRGMSPTEARRAARIAVGSVTSLKEQHRDVRALPALSSVLADIVFATRLFRREPVLFSLTIAGVALAIGITTSVFSVVDAVANRGFGIPDPASVYRFNLARGSGGNGGPWIHADYLLLQNSARSFPVAAMLKQSGRMRFGEPAADDEQPRHLSIVPVSGTFFAVMGGRAAMGRTLGEEDDRAGAVPALVLSDRFWRSEFGADRNILGRTIRLDGELFTIVGVAARGFTATNLIDLPAGWMSLTAFSELHERKPRSEFDRRVQNVEVFARLEGQTSRSKAEKEALAVALPAAAERAPFDPAERPRIASASLATSPGDASFATFAVSVVTAVVGLIVTLALVEYRQRPARQRGGTKP